jgi:putative addiction module component (TIGR02574 family)
MGMSAIDIHPLDPDERLRLIGDGWDSLRERPEDILLADAQRAQLGRRYVAQPREGLSAGKVAEAHHD